MKPPKSPQTDSLSENSSMRNIRDNWCKKIELKKIDTWLLLHAENVKDLSSLQEEIHLQFNVFHSRHSLSHVSDETSDPTLRL